MTVGDQSRVLRAFRLESQALYRAVSRLPEPQWTRPTRCDPLSVRELLAHVHVVIAWLPDMLQGPEPDDAAMTAAEYYRPDDRFAPHSNAARIAMAQDRTAGVTDGAGLAEDFARLARRVEAMCRAEPASRRVYTRHRDAMLLSEFLLTRLMELAAHGLDLADALERPPWLTPEAGEILGDLVLGSGWTTAARSLGWTRPTLLRKATGRAALDGAEEAQVEQLGVRRLTLG